MTPYPIVAPRRRRLWVAPVVLLVLAVSVLEGWAMVRLVQGPAPHAADLATEQVLDAPIAAVELGRDEIASRWQLGETPGQVALARSAYQVDLTPDEALAAWVGAYGDRYGLVVAGSTEYGLVAVGTRAGVIVAVTGGPQVAVPLPDTPADRGYAAPAEGSTVVTVEVLGLSDLDDLADLATQS